MQLLDDDDDLAYTGGKKERKASVIADARPAWMKQLLKSVTEWLKMMPKVR